MSNIETTEAALSLEDIQRAIAGDTAAIRIVTRLEPGGGPGDKVFPPTYAGGRYAMERRRLDGEDVDTVLLDSVQSQANRMELALRAAHERGDAQFPLIVADFSDEFPHIGRITALDAPHRIADAIFRESRLNGMSFRESNEGKAFANARAANATSLFELCPTALVFGVWDSTGPRGGLGAKFARALVSEIVGFRAIEGVRTQSRVDPLGIVAQSGPIYETPSGDWTLDEAEAKRDKDRPTLYGGAEGKGRPASINLGNVTPDLARDDRGQPLPGGVTIDYALQTTVLSLPALRRLRFPLADGAASSEVDQAARTALATLALAAIAYQRREGYDLRSRCLLVPTGAAPYELVPADGGSPARFALDVEQARGLLAAAVDAARGRGLPWREGEIALTPSERLIELVRRSEQVAPELPTEE